MLPTPCLFAGAVINKSEDELASAAVADTSADDEDGRDEELAMTSSH